MCGVLSVLVFLFLCFPRAYTFSQNIGFCLDMAFILFCAVSVAWVDLTVVFLTIVQ